MRSSTLCSVLASLVLAHESAAEYLTSLSSNASYDFIIVGGGTAGSVLANRLSEVSSVRVLVIEAGGSPDGNLAIEVPFLGTSLPETAVDWNYTITPQVGLNGRSFEVARGKVLGGSSCLNLMTWNRCADDLWNHWASLTGDSGWSWANIQPYYLKTSRLVPSADGHDTTGQVNPAAHGTGPVEVSVAGYIQPLDNIVVAAGKQVGGIWAYNEDVNAGNGLGTTWMQSAIGEGKRSHAASAYLEPASSRTNLDILINTQVTRLINVATSGTPVLRSVEYAQSASGPRFTVNATKEVILSAGVFASPQILQLSGVGPYQLLSNLGIKTLVNNSAVGQGLADHPMIPMWYTTNATTTWDPVLQNSTVFNADLNQWLASQTGLFVDSPADTQNFFRIPSTDPIFQLVPDPSSGSQSAHLETIFVNAFAPFGAPPPASGNYLTVLAAVVSPSSRGSVKIASTNVFDHPLINPAILTSAFDIYAAVKVMLDVQSFLQAPAFSGLNLKPYGDLATATNNISLYEYAVNNSVTVNHPMGTLAMSSNSSNTGVLDSSLRLKGATGVRVVDASVFPSVASCHIQAIVYTIAERAADLIKTQYGLS
ncbi:hypothetical protein BC835DRAFT_1409160 [Cytidiella melzeri]|nr:hypothetical protein BC835DRAFT_1409160 [Cytidiella melzeri]